jgi:hypothetical protein
LFLSSFFVDATAVQNVWETSGVRLAWGDKHTIYNNYFEAINPGSSPLRGAVVFVNGEEEVAYNGYKPVTNALVAFNTMKNCLANIVFAPDGNEVPANATTFANNIILSNVSATSSSSTAFVKVVSSAATPTNTKWINNMVWSTVSGSNTVAPNSTALAGTWVVANPKLVTTGGGWRVSSTSPAIRGSVSGSAWNSLVDEDIVYQTRAASPSNRTIGAWEYQA